MALGLKTLETPGAADEIRSRIGALTPQDAGRWGSMSVGEMVCHLHLCYAGAAHGGVVDSEPVRMWVPPSVLKWGGLRVPLRWPHGVRTIPSLERGGRAYRAPGKFAEERTRLFVALDEFLEVKNNCRPHAYFGAMSPWDWMRWGYLHTDHHLRQFGR